MTSSRPGCLRSLVLCFLAFRGTALLAQQAPPVAPAPQTTAAPQNPPQPAPAPATAPQNRNPFENVPQAPEPELPKPVPPSPEAPKPPAGVQPNAAQPNAAQPNGVQAAAPPQDVIESVTFANVRRVPQETLRSQILSKAGDKFDKDALDRDMVALWNTMKFNDIYWGREPGPNGWIITFHLVERPVIRTFDFDGLKSIQKSEILDRFKERKVGLSADSQYDPNKVQHATVVLQEYEAERGRQYATVEPQVHQVPPAGVSIIFKVDEGPKVKVNEINFMGNKVFNHTTLLRPMVNLHPYGIPHSIFLESLFPKAFDSTKLEEDEDRLTAYYRDQGYFTAKVLDSNYNIVDTGGGRFRLPLFWSNKAGKGANINISLEEGHLYHLNKVNITGMNFFRTNDVVLKLLQMDTGDVFSTAKLRKGFDDLTKYYGMFGYIDFVNDASPEPIPDTDKIDLTLNFDEGHKFFVRRYRLLRQHHHSATR